LKMPENQPEGFFCWSFCWSAGCCCGGVAGCCAAGWASGATAGAVIGVIGVSIASLSGLGFGTITAAGTPTKPPATRSSQESTGLASVTGMPATKSVNAGFSGASAAANTIVLIVPDAADRGIVGKPGLEGVILRLAAPAAEQALEHMLQLRIGRPEFGPETGLERVEIGYLVAGERRHHQLLLDGGRLDGAQLVGLGAFGRGRRQGACGKKPNRERGHASADQPSHRHTHIVCYPRQHSIGV